MFHAIDKAAHEQVSIFPHEYTILILWFVIYEFTDIDIASNILESVAMLTIILKFTLVKSTISTNLHFIFILVTIRLLMRYLVDEQTMAMEHLVTNIAIKPTIISLSDNCYMF